MLQEPPPPPEPEPEPELEPELEPEPEPSQGDSESTVPMVDQTQNTTAVDVLEEGRATDVELGGDASRRLKVLLGVPMVLEEASLKLDVDEHGKTRLSFDPCDVHDR